MTRFSFYLVTFSLALSLQTANGAEEFRKWKDTSGKFEIEAKFVSVQDGKVNLVRRDGKTVAVPLDKLSLVDQGYVEGRMIGNDAGSESPFKEVSPLNTDMKPSAGSGIGSETAETAGAMREWKVVWDDCPETTLQVGDWHPKIGDQPLDFKIKATSLPPKADFFEGMASITAVNRVAKRAVLSYHLGRHGQPSRTRMVMIDTELGKVLSNATGEGKWVALAISDDGQKIVVRNDSENQKDNLGRSVLAGKSDYAN